MGNSACCVSKEKAKMDVKDEIDRAKRKEM
jgi:hypothetical protein